MRLVFLLADSRFEGISGAQAYQGILSSAEREGGTMRFRLRVAMHKVAALLLGTVGGLNVSFAAAAVAAEPMVMRPTLEANWRFPSSDFVIDVTKPPYSAKGDGKTDDTAALQQAIRDTNGTHKVLYLPKGTYLISETLNWTNRGPKNRSLWGFTWIQGQNPAKCILRLADGTFRDPNKPKAMMWCGGFGSADWFHNYVQGMTFDVGKNNPGAIGLQFYSNNFGAVRDCVITSGDGQGMIGLDLGHRDMNGPLLVQRVRVEGFRRGITTAGAVNSQTFEHVTLSGQTEFGMDNHGQSIAIRRLQSDNAVPAVRSYGHLSLLEASLTGREGAKNVPGVVNYNGGRVCLRDVRTTGYARALADVTTPDYAAALRVKGVDKPGSEGPHLKEYYSHPATNPFGGPVRTLRLPIRETPEVAWEDPKTWAVVDAYGADPTGRNDSAEAIQKAIDSGATTVFLPGFYTVHKPVVLRGKVRRFLGTGGWIDYNAKSKPDLIVEDGEAKVVVVEHFSTVNGGIEVKTGRTVVFRSLGCRRIRWEQAGEVYLEDVTTDDVRLKRGQKVWARQLNVENEGTHVTNEGADLWVLGFKTERGGTLLRTRNRGRSEVFGTFSYTTTKGKLAPMFVTEDASVFAFFSEVCYTGDPFAVLIRETRGGETREIRPKEGSVAPYVSVFERK